MNKIKNLSTLILAPILFFGCETTQKRLGQTFQTTMQGQRPEVQQSIKDVTHNGTTIDMDRLKNTVSNPGSIDYDCAASSFDTPKTKPVVNSSGDGKDPRYQVSLKNYPRPSKGCIPVKSVSLADARKAMKAQNLTTEGATEMEERTLGAGLIRIQQLNGGPLATGKWGGKDPYPFRIKDGNGYSGQRHDHILVQRNGGRKYGLSVAQHVHEYAHLIGNQGGYKAYQKYMGNAGYCMVSNYADNSSGEQFAEVFTAFVTEPSILLNNSRTPAACKKAFEFFKGWFGKGERVKDCMD